ncbi:MAG: hypothetical protein LKCHEGNO_01682 [Burkholderiaceae bacterium]|nr:hypothetical protein [Burkholderiaceae bacterium]
MLAFIRRWWPASTPKPSLQGIEQWAHDRRAQWHRVRDDGGFVIDGAHGSMPWRIEWGQSHRHYIAGAELRFIAELGLHRDLQVMVLNRALMLASEARVYDEYVQGVQTRVDTQTPTEIRWLVMHTKLSATELGRLGLRFGAVASVKPWLLAWLTGPLPEALLDAARQLRESDAFVLSIVRGRLGMRLGMRDPRPERIERWLGLFEVAIDEARRVAGQWRDSALPAASTRPSVWPRDAAGDTG